MAGIHIGMPAIFCTAKLPALLSTLKGATTVQIIIRTGGIRLENKFFAAGGIALWPACPLRHAGRGCVPAARQKRKPGGPPTRKRRTHLRPLPAPLTKAKADSHHQGEGSAQPVDRRGAVTFVEYHDALFSLPGACSVRPGTPRICFYPSVYIRQQIGTSAKDAAGLQ